jgi:hypothetical protein
MWGLTYQRRKEARHEIGDDALDARKTGESAPGTKPVPSALGNST